MHQGHVVFFFYCMHSFFVSEAAAYITHNAALVAAVQLEIQVDDASCCQVCSLLSDFLASDISR